MSTPLAFDPEAHGALLPSIVDLHIACVTRDHMLATFLPPLDAARMQTWWVGQVADPLNTTFVTLSGPLPMAPPAADQPPLPWVTGLVQLREPFSQTEPFKGEVLKLMVHPDARRQGIAKRLMARLELEAEGRGKPILMLDTEVGSPAEAVYPRMGYVRVGVIPKYGISPKDGRLTDEVWFYKDLRKVKRLEI